MTKKKRIVFLESASKMGGVQFSTLYLTQNLNQKAWDPLVICPDDGDMPQACRDAGVPVQIIHLPSLCSTSLRFGIDYRLPNPFAWIWNFGVLLIAALRLWSFFYHYSPNLVITKGLSSHLYGGLASRLVGIPCVWHLQDFISERFGGLYRHFFGLVARILPAHIIVDGTPISRQLPKNIQLHVSVVFNGVDTQLFHPDVDGVSVRQEFDIPDDALVIGNVARLTAWKGQHFLLDAFAQLTSLIPNSYLLIVGSPVFDNDDYEGYLKSRTRNLGIEEQVIFTGYRRDLTRVLASMDIFAYTAVEKDTSPLSLLSAMAVGLPIVAFDIEGIREVVGDAGLLAPVSQATPLASALKQMMGSPSCRIDYSQKSRLRAEKFFSLDQYVSSIHDTFISVL